MYMPLDAATAGGSDSAGGFPIVGGLSSGAWSISQVHQAEALRQTSRAPLGNAITIPKSGADAPAQGVQVLDLRSGGSRPTDARSSAPNEARSASAL